MSVINLKDEKRINVNGEWDKVTTHPNNEPIYRSNGHQLEFDGDNGDYLEIPLDFTMTDGTYIEFKVFSNEETTTDIVFSSGSSEYVSLNFPSGNRLFIFCNGKGNNILAGQIFRKTWHTIKLYRESGTNYAQVDGGVAEAFTNSVTDLLVLSASDLVVNKLGSAYGKIVIDYIDFNGNKFEAVNINSGAQIEGSNGSIAQVNSDNTDAVAGSPNNFLKLNASNSDFISTQFSNTSITETSDIDLEFEFYMDSFDGGRIRLFHFSDENSEGVNSNKAFWFETSTTRSDVLFRQSNSDGSVVANPKNLGSPIIGVNKVKILNGEAFLNGVKTSTNPNNYTLDITNPHLKIARFFNSASFTDLTLSNFSVQGETFTTENVNASAQIIGSEGTVAQINTSAAGGTSYILDTVWSSYNYILGDVFNKSSFALSFEGANVEYLTIPNPQPWSTFGDVDLEFTFDGSLLTSENVIFSYAISSTEQILIAVDGSSNLFLRVRIGGNTYSNFDTVSNYLKINTIKILNGVIDVNNGELTIDFSAENSTILFNSDLFFGALAYLTPYWNPDIVLYDCLVSGTKYPLTEGLGPTTNDAQIITSAANAQERINFGIWQKNKDLLNFDRDNLDHIVLPQRKEFTGDFYVEATINSKIDDTTQMLFMDDSGFLGEIRPYTLGRLRFRVSDGTTYYSATNILPINTTYKLKVERVGSDVNVYVDGVLEDTFTADNSSIGVKVIGLKGSFSFEGSVYSFNINGETYLLREGGGNITTSESGNLDATINTSAADPTGYINSNVWDVDSNKWIDYAKE